MAWPDLLLYETVRAHQQELLESARVNRAPASAGTASIRRGVATVIGRRESGVVDAAFDRAQLLFGAPRHACTGGGSDGRGESDAAGAATPMARSSTANLPTAATDFALAELHGSAAALARSMR